MNARRVCIVSYDFKQPKEANQARKTRFFRELYGYTQQVKQQLKGGEVITRTYRYDGILDRMPYVKLGKSVLGVLPGTEDPILKLMREFEEIVFYCFIGWLPDSLWFVGQNEEELRANQLIIRFGFLSILIMLKGFEGRFQKDLFLNQGFDIEFVDQALEYLLQSGLVVKKDDGFECTKNGEEVLRILILE